MRVFSGRLHDATDAAKGLPKKHQLRNARLTAVGLLTASAACNHRCGSCGCRHNFALSMPFRFCLMVSLEEELASCIANRGIMQFELSAAFPSSFRLLQILLPLKSHHVLGRLLMAGLTALWICGRSFSLFWKAVAAVHAAFTCVHARRLPACAGVRRSQVGSAALNLLVGGRASVLPRCDIRADEAKKPAG